PDFIENDGKFWVTETQKSVARVHAIDRSLLEKVWNQHTSKKISTQGLVLDKAAPSPSKDIVMKPLPSLKEGGFTIDLWLEIQEFVPGQVILDNLDADGRGIQVSVSPKRTIQLSLHDQHTMQAWDT